MLLPCVWCGGDHTPSAQQQASVALQGGTNSAWHTSSGGLAFTSCVPNKMSDRELARFKVRW